jgi:hypothetical protein
VLRDELHIDIDDNECELTNNIVNGYFYIMHYHASTEQANKEGFDRAPIIYCFAPDQNNINCFWGVNFHYFDKSKQVYILNRMIKYYNITDGMNKRVLIDTKGLYNIYSNIVEGVRCYNRKNVLGAYRIKNLYIPKYIEIPSKFVITTDNKEYTDFALAPGNKGF